VVDVFSVVSAEHTASIMFSVVCARKHVLIPGRGKNFYFSVHRLEGIWHQLLDFLLMTV
jgi:hypothetical protein